MRPKRVGEPRGNREDQKQLQKIREGRGIFKGMRAIGVERAAAVGAEFLDGFLRGNRPLRDHLIGHGLRRGLAVGAGRLHGLRIQELGRVVGLQILNHALRNEDQRDDQDTRAAEPTRSSASCRPRNFRSFWIPCRAIPRITAMAITMPTAAEAKLW